MNMLTSAGLSGAGMIAVALTPNLKIAAVCTSYMVSLFHLFAGFVMTQPDMPGWWYACLALPALPWTDLNLQHAQLYQCLGTLLTGRCSMLALALRAH